MRKSCVRDCRIGEGKLNCLQKVSSETEETSKAGTGHGESLVGTGSSDGGWGGSWATWGDGGTDGTLGGGSWGWGTSDWDSGIGVHWGAGWDGNYSGGGHWLDDGARAVGDGQGGGGAGSVGDAIEGQLGGSWAHGGVCGVDLSGVHNGAVGSIGGDGGCESKNGGG